MTLVTLWFCVIAFFWFGYLFLEGFDFGVGMLLPLLARDNAERRVMINTIGPVWDGNEVWVIVAVAATFAAFPGWYAGLLSGTYLLVLLVLLGLIGRGVAFEYRGKVDSSAGDGTGTGSSCSVHGWHRWASGRSWRPLCSACHSTPLA